MYYPYFRGKQFDLIALRELSEKGRLSDKIIPIIEPVKNSAALQKVLAQFEKVDQPYYLVENPQVGDFQTENGYQQLQELSDRRAHILTQPLESSETTAELLILQSPAVALASDWQTNHLPVLLPPEFRLLRHIKGPRIISEDPFTRLPRNTYYGERPDEFFSDRATNFASRGFVGFSDFLIDSRIYYEHSYPARQLCLHLAYQSAGSLRLHHYLSPELPTQKEMYQALLAEIATDTKMQEQPTLGLDLLLTAFQQDKFPGMGIMRKASMMHFLEIMGQIVDNRKQD